MIGTIERPKRGYIYPQIWREIKAATVTEDPQRERVYRWEEVLLGDMDTDDLGGRHPRALLGQVPGRRGITKQEARAGATAYLEHLWTNYSPYYNPYFPGLPYLRIGYTCVSLRLPKRRRPSKAHARIQAHSIFCPLDRLYRQTIVHEVCHILTWRDHHGPEFCAALVHLWWHEFGVRESTARFWAEERGVHIAGNETLLGPSCEEITAA